MHPGPLSVEVLSASYLESEEPIGESRGMALRAQVPVLLYLGSVPILPKLIIVGLCETLNLPELEFPHL